MVIRVSDKKQNYNNVTKLLVKPNYFQTASLHGNDKQTILKVGGGINGK